MNAPVTWMTVTVQLVTTNPVPTLANAHQIKWMLDSILTCYQEENVFVSLVLILIKEVNSILWLWSMALM